MLFQDAFKTATRSLTHGKMRSILTMLGIVIGIASVIALMSIGQSAQDYILGQVAGHRFEPDVRHSRRALERTARVAASAQGIVITTLNQRDVDNLKREPSVAAAEPEVRGSESRLWQ